MQEPTREGCYFPIVPRLHTLEPRNIPPTTTQPIRVETNIPSSWLLGCRHARMPVRRGQLLERPCDLSARARGRCCPQATKKAIRKLILSIGKASDRASADRYHEQIGGPRM